MQTVGTNQDQRRKPFSISFITEISMVYETFWSLCFYPRVNLVHKANLFDNPMLSDCFRKLCQLYFYAVYSAYKAVYNI